MIQELQLQDSISFLTDQEKRVVQQFINDLNPRPINSKREAYRRAAMKEIRMALRSEPSA